jgi:hypothetical protein
MTPEAPECEISLFEAEMRAAADRQPINDQLGFHDFQESEFAAGAGRCDKCGGGPLAAIHQKPVDQLERLVSFAAQIAADLNRIADALERPRAGGFWRAVDWVARFFQREGSR